MRARSGYAFGRTGADRSDLLRSDADQLLALWPDSRVILVDPTGAAVAESAPGEAPRLYLPQGVDHPELLSSASLLGRDDTGQCWFALPAERVPNAPGNRIELRAAAARLDPLQAGLLAYARSLLHWQRRSRHCGQCGAPLSLSRAGHQAICPVCRSEFYPRTDPAVIVLVSDGERVLLGRQATWPARRYSVLAGFVEPGEQLEEAIEREVMEEAGLRVLESRYVASQPWPFPSALMIGFTALAEAGEPRFGDELEDARWFDVDSLLAEVRSGQLLLSPRISIARRLIEDWLEQQGAAVPDTLD
jgi:NAD+ diphosphatase